MEKKLFPCTDAAVVEVINKGGGGGIIREGHLFDIMA